MAFTCPNMAVPDWALGSVEGWRERLELHPAALTDGQLMHMLTALGRQSLNDQAIETALKQAVAAGRFDEAGMRIIE